MKPNASHHAYERVQERLGSRLSSETVARIVSDISEGKAIPLHQGTTPTTIVVAVYLDGKAVPVVYDFKTKTIVTVMHRNAILKALGKELSKLQEIQD